MPKISCNSWSTVPNCAGLYKSLHLKVTGSLMHVTSQTPQGSSFQEQGTNLRGEVSVQAGSKQGKAVVPEGAGIGTGRRRGRGTVLGSNSGTAPF